jgi:hypothetical protein
MVKENVEEKVDVVKLLKPEVVVQLKVGGETIYQEHNNN